jgi:hypothetical protein
MPTPPPINESVIVPERDPAQSLRAIDKLLKREAGGRLLARLLATRETEIVRSDVDRSSEIVRSDVDRSSEIVRSDVDRS